MNKKLPFCKCGCGKRVSNLNNKYIYGHTQRGVIQSEETKNKRRNTIKNKINDNQNNNINNPLCQCGCGERVSNSKNKYIWGHNAKDIIITQETREKLRIANFGKTYEEKYGKEKADEIKKKVGLKSKGRIPACKGKTWDEYYGKEKADEMRKILSEKNTGNPKLKDRKGEKNPYYKGAKDSLYKHWSPKLNIDKNRENKEGKIEVKCTYCGKWFIPTSVEMDNRIRALKQKEVGNDFYCSKECKELCPDFYQVLWPKNYKPYDNHYNNRRVEVDPNLRQMVFERDDWTCQKCEKKESLECHHIDPVSQNPMLANDMDSCITLCKECHKFIHMNIKGCGYNELKCANKGE